MNEKTQYPLLSDSTKYLFLGEGSQQFFQDELDMIAHLLMTDRRKIVFLRRGRDFAGLDT